MATCLCTGSCWRCRPLAVRLGSQAHRARNCKRLLSQEKEVSACACAREAVGCGRAREQGEKGRESGATSSQPPRRALLGHAALLVERRVAGGHHLKGGPWRRRGCLRRGPRRRRGLPPHAHETGKVLGRSRWLSSEPRSAEAQSGRSITSMIKPSRSSWRLTAICPSHSWRRPLGLWSGLRRVLVWRHYLNAR